MMNDMKHIQSEIVLPIFKPIPINIKHKKSIDIKENDHIEPRILNMLKDVYVGVDYLSDCDFNKDGNIRNTIKIITYIHIYQLKNSINLFYCFQMINYINNKILVRIFKIIFLLKRKKI